MSTIGGLSTSTTSGLSGYGGLASGLDRDSLIEGMTQATQSKIDSQEQKKTLYSWEQDAIQDLTTKLYEFSSKYMSFTSSDNLLGSALFTKSDTTAMGDNADMVTIVGGMSSSALSILGVKSTASNTTMSSNGKVSDSLLSTKAPASELNLIEDRMIKITYGSSTYNIVLEAGDEFDFSTKEGVVAAINKQMSEIDLSLEDTKLSDVVKVEMRGDKVAFVNTDKHGNKLELAGGTHDILQSLGYLEEGETSMTEDERKITTDGLVATNDIKLTEEVTLQGKLSEASLTFTYNGEAKTINLEEYTDTTTNEEIRADIQDKLNKEFGSGRIEVSMAADGSMSFKTTLPNTGGTEDFSSTLALTSASFGVLGSNGILGVEKGESNRLNMSASLSEAGFERTTAIDESEDLIIKNGDKELNLSDLDLTWDSSVSEIVKAINESDLGVTVNYQEVTDRFIITSNEPGASGNIELTGNVADVMFGVEGTDYEVKQGNDAVFSVKFEATGEVVEMTRSSNTVNLDGMTVSLNEAFGYEGDTLATDTEAIKFNSTINTEDATETVKTMIEDYNKLIEEINSLVSEKPDRDYAPLTDAMKKDMSESQIELWEEEAKKGLLFNDSDINALADDLRFIIPSSMREQFEDMGITVSTDYKDNGKLTFDETKFAAALAEDPDAVRNAFTASGTEDGEAGLMVNIKEVTDKYAGMTGAVKGILVERAGSQYAPTSVIQNSLQNSIDDIDDYIVTLQDKLEMEQDRYIQQFTALETLISEMNSQSSYLSSMFSSY